MTEKLAPKELITFRKITSASKKIMEVFRYFRIKRDEILSTNLILSKRELWQAVTDKGEEIGLIISKAEKQLRRSGDSPLKGSCDPLQVPAADSRQKTLTGLLNIYYDAVIASIRGTESILIFGPGDRKDLSGHVSGRSRDFRHRRSASFTDN